MILSNNFFFIICQCRERYCLTEKRKEKMDKLFKPVNRHLVWYSFLLTQSIFTRLKDLTDKKMMSNVVHKVSW